MTGKKSYRPPSSVKVTPLFQSLPIQEMHAITLTQGDEKTHLIRRENNEWGIQERDGYPIDYQLLGDLLGSLDTLNVAQGYPVSREYFKQFGLEHQSDDATKKKGYVDPITVTMLGKDGKTLEEITLGKFSGTTQVTGRFVYIAGDDSGVYTVQQTFPGVTADAKDWLGKDFLKMNQVRSISVSAPADSTFTPWELTRPNDTVPFKLSKIKEGEFLQLTATNVFQNLFANSQIQDVLDQARADETSASDVKLKRSSTIETFDGLTYHLEFWPQKQAEADADADDRLPPAPPSYHLTVKVDFNFPKERQKGADESPEDAKNLDQQFIVSQKAAEQKFNAAKAFEGRIFQIGYSHIAALLKTRSDFVKQ